jgi:hypothetical protein
MISLAILAGLGGALLGLRFRGLVLLPVAAAALVVVVAGGLAVGLALVRLALACLIAGVALQLGFLGGAGVRVLLIAGRSGDLRQPSGTTGSRAAQ